jgi:hypothetical protein
MRVGRIILVEMLADGLEHSSKPNADQSVKSSKED